MVLQIPEKRLQPQKQPSMLRSPFFAPWAKSTGEKLSGRERAATVRSRLRA